MRLFNFENIKYDLSSKGYLVILSDNKTKDKFSILIGSNEAQSLSLTYENIKLPRPRTNELLINFVEEINGNFKSIIINKYEKGTFYASINIEISNSSIHLDSRPSDAIEIAIKEKLPIYINNSVIELIKNKNIIKDQNTEKEFENFNYNIDEIKNNLMDALNKSIIEENYEIAAKLRDRIKKLSAKKI
tara:strand:+ start:568 stop:1134 length:567 start_codon:yes stop_codon:yes gene_type:complete